MELTRRDALAALAVAGAGSLAGCEGAAPPTASDEPPTTGSDTRPLNDGEVATLVAAAEVVYPDAVEGIPEFVGTYALGRVADRPDHGAGLREAVADLDALARDWHGEAFADLPRSERDQLLRDVGIPGVESDPDGPLPERLRFFVVNDLLYALYASPTGGKLVGIENPIGYPGGIESYRQPAPAGDSDG